MTRHYPGTTSTEVSERELTSARLARRAAAEGIVLLENDGTLPLERGARLCLYGGGALYTVKGGTGSGSVNNRGSVSIADGLREAGFALLNEDWLDACARAYQREYGDWMRGIYEAAGAPGDFMRLYRAHATRPMALPEGGAIEKKDTDTAVYVISRVSGEGADRRAVPGDYYLSESELASLRAVTALYEKTIVVLNVGGVIDLSFLDELPVAALVLLSQAGMEGGRALADVLAGAVNPSGRLTDTWALRYGDYPSSATFGQNDGNVIEEKYTEGIYVGYRYFDSFGVTPRYPFGFGLSYTTFELADSRVAAAGGGVEVSVTVRNTGARAGRQVVLLYAGLPEGDRDKEHRRLAAFAKTRLLAPGEEEAVDLSFPLERLSSYHTARSEVYLDAGVYPLWAEACDADLAARPGDDAPRTFAKRRALGGLTLGARAVLDRLTPICPLLDALKELRASPAPRQPEIEASIPIDDAAEQARAAIARRHRADAERPLPFREEVEAVLAKMTPEQKARLLCGEPSDMSGEIIGAAATHVPGAAGETTNRLRDLGVPHLILADGPAGLRLTRHYQVDPEDGGIYRMNRYESLENRLFGKEFLHEGAEDHYQFATAIPVGTLLAQSFDVALLESVGDMIGREMEEFGVHLWLAPGMNIHRNPLCGRNFEYCSEDPLVSGKMAAAIARGVEAHPRCGVTIKHFACNNQEENRRGVSSIVSERALREIYLKGFEIAVTEAHPRAIMTSYNKVNGVHAANSFDLCTTAARREWGFTGIIMTDWTTTNSDGGSSAAKCVLAGNDLTMPGTQSDIREIVDAFGQKRDLSLPMESVDDCARRMLSMIFTLAR